MSTKKTLPVLAQFRNKQRKRNIVKQANPTQFKETLIEVLSEGLDSEVVFNLVIENEHELDFSRYRDYFFDLLFSGGIGVCVGKVEKSVVPYKHSFFGIQQENPPDIRKRQKEILDLLIQFLRRKPILETSLSIVIEMMLNSYALLEDVYRDATTSLVAQLIVNKIGKCAWVLSLLKNDTLVTSGIPLTIITDIFKKIINPNEGGQSIKTLINLLIEGKILDRLYEFFPLNIRTPQHLEDHFTKNNLAQVAKIIKSRKEKVNLTEIQLQITKMITDFYKREEELREGEEEEDEESEEKDKEKEKNTSARLDTLVGNVIDDTLEEIRPLIISGSEEEGSASSTTTYLYPQKTLVSVMWDGLTSAFEWSSLKMGVSEVKERIHQDLGRWARLLLAFIRNNKEGEGNDSEIDLQMHLLKQIQGWFYNNVSLQKYFLEAVHELYVCEVLDEDVILAWNEGNSPDLQAVKGRDLFKENLAPFVLWLQLAEEKSDDEK